MSKDKKIFILRVALFSVFSAILPFVFIGWRFKIFSAGNTSLRLTGWGIIALIIAFAFIKYVSKMLQAGKPFSMFTQCVNGFIKVILPLIILYGVVNTIRNNTEAFMSALTVVIVLETIAIPINPFPKWVKENHIEMEKSKIGRIIEVMKGEEK